MCDYSIKNAKTRPAVVDDKLVVHDFGMTTRGFAPVGEPGTAVCLLPGTELVFDEPVEVLGYYFVGKPRTISERTARFRQINKDDPHNHHDALEFGDGNFILLTHLAVNQHATVLQLPAAPKTKQEAEDQTRIPVVA